ncbi:MAG TPA: EamA family transporter [Ktedonobacteraceae bacterium]|nr:EamA family transporter [Ktedonobacteraceae bacterium]
MGAPHGAVETAARDRQFRELSASPSEGQGTIKSTISQRSTTGYLMVAGGAILFGVNGNISTLLFNDGVTPLTLISFRMLIGGMCLVAVMLFWQRKALKAPRRHWAWIIVFGLVLAINTFSYFLAISRLPLAVALVIIFTSATWIALGEALWRRQMPSLQVLISLGLSLIGVVLLTGIWHASLNKLDTLGLFYALLGLVAYTAYLLCGRRVGRYLPSITSTGYGAIVASIFWFSIQPPWAIPAKTWSPYHLMLILLVGTIGMAVPFALVVGGLRRVDAARVGIVAMLELPASGIIAYFLLGQHLDIAQILGCLFVLAGVTTLQYGKPTLQSDI